MVAPSPSQAPTTATPDQTSATTLAPTMVAPSPEYDVVAFNVSGVVDYPRLGTRSRARGPAPTTTTWVDRDWEGSRKELVFYQVLHSVGFSIADGVPFRLATAAGGGSEIALDKPSVASDVTVRAQDCQRSPATVTPFTPAPSEPKPTLAPAMVAPSPSRAPTTATPDQTSASTPAPTMVAPSPSQAPTTATPDQTSASTPAPTMVAPSPSWAPQALQPEGSATTAPMAPTAAAKVARVATATPAPTLAFTGTAALPNSSSASTPVTPALPAVPPLMLTAAPVPSAVTSAPTTTKPTGTSATIPAPTIAAAPALTSATLLPPIVNPAPPPAPTQAALVPPTGSLPMASSQTALPYSPPASWGLEQPAQRAPDASRGHMWVVAIVVVAASVACCVVVVAVVVRRRSRRRRAEAEALRTAAGGLVLLEASDFDPCVFSEGDAAADASARGVGVAEAHPAGRGLSSFRSSNAGLPCSAPASQDRSPLTPLTPLPQRSSRYYPRPGSQNAPPLARPASRSLPRARVSSRATRPLFST
eukprot:TRINITY_DN2789_c0_g1_i3.p1 TRINITY_DN2789_c0_g1~~TRINITY_DN2789_c0_g1_i3.p1  ORF type:complete len:548 (+),score=-5.20 TRINITY_DN2789_c0_g1_i3:48-1646(+)